MNNPAASVFRAPEKAQSLVRADALEAEITELCAHINAASYRLLQLVAALDDEEPWGSWGLTSCAHWLNWRCGIGLNAAREKVRVAHALKPLARISASFASGELSFSKVRALTRIADTGNEAELLDLARYATAAQVEKLVRAYRRVGRLEERERAMAQHASRELSYYYDDDGSLVIRARLPADEGAVVLQALNAAMDAQERDVESEDVTAVTSAVENRFAQRRADALTTMAETTLRHGPAPQSSAERYQVVVHVTAETLATDEDGRCELDSGQRLAPDAASLATAACCTSPRISWAIHSISAARPARCRLRYGGRCKRAMLAAGFRAAVIAVSSMRITSNTGQTAAGRRSTISCYCAAVTTASCTKADSVSKRSPTVAFISRGPMPGSLTISPGFPAGLPKHCATVISRPTRPSTHRRGSFQAMSWTTTSQSADCCRCDKSGRRPRR